MALRLNCSFRNDPICFTTGIARAAEPIRRTKERHGGKKRCTAGADRERTPGSWTESDKGPYKFSI
jgi:hypothetical protein